MMPRLASVLLTVLVAALSFADDVVIHSLDESPFRPTNVKGTATSVKGHDGLAVELKFDKDCQNVFFTSTIRGKPQWDKAVGFSFWVKGNGQRDVGVLQFIYDDDYAVRYEFAFTLTDAEWHQVTVAWSDLVPVLPGEHSKPLDPERGNLPSKLSTLWVGKWWHWRDYPAQSFTLDDLRLEPKIERPPVAASEGLQTVRKKLKAGEPITIVTMGDSLTDPRHWANRQTVWPDLVKRQLEARYKSKVTIVNPAIGGTQLRQGLIQTPRWLGESPEPDLVTICFGGNDWESGMRGPQFEESLRLGIDHLRRATGGKASLLILSTVPSVERWETTSELADACRSASKAKQIGLADLQKAFHLAGKTDRERLFVNDKVHLSAAGHELVAKTVLEAIEGE